MARIIIIPLLALFLVKAEAKSVGRAITPDDLTAVNDIVNVAVSPNGDRVAYLIRQAVAQDNSYRQKWSVLSIATGQNLERLVDGGDAELSVRSDGRRSGAIGIPIAAWSPDGEWFAYTKLEDGQRQLWRAKFDGAVEQQLTRNLADVEEFEWSEDGSKIYFTVDRARGVTDKADRIDGLDGFLVSEPMPPIANNGLLNWPRCVRQRPGLAPTPGDRQCVRTLWVYDFATQTEREATAAERAAQRRLVEVASVGYRPSVEREAITSNDGARRAWFENPDPVKYPGYIPPGRVTVGAGDEKENAISCLAPECVGFGLLKLWWTPDNATVLFLANDGPADSFQSLYAWRPGSKAVRSILRSDVFRLKFCDWADEKLICVRDGARRPDHIVSLDVSTGNVRVLADPNVSYQQFEFTKVEKLLYDDGDGLDTYAHLVYPASYEPGKRYPIVVVQYRTRGFLRGGTGDEQPIHVYAQSGMFVLSTHMASDQNLYAKIADYVELNAADWKDFRGSQLRAILRALDALEDRGLIDPGRIGISGLSNGATITERALVSTDRFTAASAAYANTSPLGYYLFPSTESRTTLFRGMHPFSDEGLGVWRKYSSGLNAEKVREPYLLQVADREYFHTLQNYIDLKDAGSPVEMHIFPDEYHVKWQPAHRLAVYNRNLDWFRFWLQGYEDVDPGKAEQYTRWRKMRDDSCTTSQSDVTIELPVYCH